MAQACFLQAIWAGSASLLCFLPDPVYTNAPCCLVMRRQRILNRLYLIDTPHVFSNVFEFFRKNIDLKSEKMGNAASSGESNPGIESNLGEPKAIRGEVYRRGKEPSSGSGNDGSVVQEKRDRYTPPPGVRIKEVEAWIRNTRWEVTSIVDGIRILKPSLLGQASTEGSGNAEVPPCYRVNVSINAPANVVLRRILDFPPSCVSGPIKSVRVIQKLEEYVDIIHIVLEPMQLYPSMTAARDLCVMRYWKQLDDGNYIICLDSTTHDECPLMDDCVRAQIHSAYMIATPKDDQGLYESNEESTGSQDECMVSYIAQLDPKGWILTQFGYREMVLEKLMMHLIDIRDDIDINRFTQIEPNPMQADEERRRLDSFNSGAKNGAADEKARDTNTTSTSSAGTSSGSRSNSFEMKEKEMEDTEKQVLSVQATPKAPKNKTQGKKELGSIPAHACPEGMYHEPDSSTFNLRGFHYMTNKTKVSSAPSIFKLIAIDVFDTGPPQRHICNHPKNRVFLAAQRGDPTWVFVMNIMIPGTPNLSFVAYWEGDRAMIEADTPFGRIARPFFNGSDDEFRNNRFKLIPKVVEGNFLIKQAVKDTPTLLGNKLDQYYYKGDNYFELDVDVGSSTIARNITGLAASYSKNIIVDMACCLQGNEESELPEVLMGACTVDHLDTSLAVKLNE